MDVPTLDDLAAGGRRLGVRVDVNSPLAEHGLADDARLRAHLETLSELAAAGARVAVLAHQGRPGRDDFGDLAPHAARFDELLDAAVDYVDGTFCRTARDRIDALGDGELVVLENTRFYSEELLEFSPGRAAETHLVAKLSPVLDAFVNDAFAAAHRPQPSLVGFSAALPAFAGRVMERELEVLGAIDETARPRVYVLGGAKAADSLRVAERVLERELADEVLTMGLVGNLFLSASGTYIGDGTAAVFDDRGVTGCIDRAAELLEAYPERIRVPSDLAVSRGDARTVVSVEELPVAEPAFDIGPATAAAFAETIEAAGTVILNGPAGVAERDRFAAGTRTVYEAATRAGTSIVGGGDTAAALRRLGISGFTHLSTGGGATLRMLAGDSLPAVEALRDAD
ncbi:MAG: phosphoglycerate kinase [Halobacteriales archaeon]